MTYTIKDIKWRHSILIQNQYEDVVHDTIKKEFYANYHQCDQFSGEKALYYESLVNKYFTELELILLRKH